MDPTHPESLYPNKWPKVVLLGDSLTQHAFDGQGDWGGRLSSLLQRKADVVNRGFSGYNTELLKLALPRLEDPEFWANEVACLTLCIGANDSWNPTTFKFNPSLSVERYRQNLIEIIEFLLSNGLNKAKILLLTPPTIESQRWNDYCKANKEFPIEKTAEQTRKYADAMIDVGRQFDIRTFDLFELTSRPEHLNRAFHDGLHFSSYGAELVYELAKNDVERLVTEHRGTNRENFPTYLEADFNHPETFFTGEPSTSL